MKKDEAIRLIEEMHDELVTNELELRALTIEKGEARAMIQVLKANLSASERDLAGAKDYIETLVKQLNERGDRIDGATRNRDAALARVKQLERDREIIKEELEKTREIIEDLECRPTLVQQGRMLDDINLLQAKLNEREERISAGKAENAKLRANALANSGRELELEGKLEEVEKKLEFWKGWGIVIGMMIANVIWLISKVIF